MATATIEQVPVPAWYTGFTTSFQANEATCFVLYGDVQGHAAYSVTNRTYLVQTLGARRAIVAYNRAQGITFPRDVANGTRADRESALALLGVGKQQPPQNSPFAAALAAGGGASQQQQADPFEQAATPLAALRLIERLMREPQAKGTYAVLIEYGDLLMPEANKGTMDPDSRTLLALLLSWANDASLGKQANPVLLTCNNLLDMHRDVRSSVSGWKAIEVRLPDLEARLAYTSAYLAGREARGKAIAMEMAPREFAMATAGLSNRHLEDILLLGARAGQVTRALVKARKDAIIVQEYSDVAEMIEPLSAGFAALGGMEALTSYFRYEVIEPLRRGQVADVPKGVLLVGPPGTGKTFTVRALAQETGFNAVSLRAERILGGIVGESEAKLARFLSFVRALAPCLVFVDEIDQSDMARRGQGSGNPVASNLFNQLLQFMSDETNRGRVVVVFASNRPDLLDPALKRTGRMDAIIPVLLPEEAARTSIIEVQAATQGCTLEKGAAGWLAGQTRNYSGADLMGLVMKARKLAQRESAKQVARKHLERAWNLVRPSGLDTAEYYTLLAVQACNDAEFLPEQYAKLLRDRQELDRTIAEQQPTSLVREEREL